VSRFSTRRNPNILGKACSGGKNGMIGRDTYGHIARRSRECAGSAQRSGPGRGSRASSISRWTSAPDLVDASGQNLGRGAGRKIAIQPDFLAKPRAAGNARATVIKFEIDP